MDGYPVDPTPLQHFRLLGRSGLRVSPLCLGTMTFGQNWQHVLGNCDFGTAQEIFDTYVRAGGNFIDCADKYQEGEAESWLGEFIAASQWVEREDLVLASKYSLPTPVGRVNRAGNHRKNLISSVEASLARLQTTYLDILYVHFYDGTVKADELMRNLHYLCASGKVLHIAISDAPAWFVAQCNTVADAHGWPPFCGYQGRYSAADRDVEGEVLPMCKALDIGFIPWSVLGAGKLASKNRMTSTRGKGELTELQGAVHDAVVKVADKLGRGVAQVAISWCASMPGVTSVLVGARKVEHIEAAIDAMSFRLSDQDQGDISAAGMIEHQFPTCFLKGTDYLTIAWTRGGGRITDRFDAPVAKPRKKKRDKKGKAVDEKVVDETIPSEKG